MKIILLGYMGSGKTFVGSELANVLEVDFIDLDVYIQEKEQLKISDIFFKKGEIYFRKIERKYLEELLENDKKCVISLGGGTPCYFDTITFLKNRPTVTTIYLEVSVVNLCNRLFLQKAQRPLIAHLKTKEALVEFVGKHLFERVVFYNKATVKVNANTNAKAIVRQIVAQLF